MKNCIRLAAILLILGTPMLPARSLDFSPAYAVEPWYSVTGGSTIYVDASNVSRIEDGTQAHPYNRIQEGLGVALSGDTVRVAAGTYFENITLKDGVMLRGAGAKVTRIDGGGDGSVVIANNLGTGAVLDGFTLTNVDNLGNGIATNIYPVGFETGSATIQNNILWGNNDDLVNLSATYSDIEDGDPGEGNISTYPMFINPTQKDYRLRPDLLCIDKGINDGAPKLDMEGDPRPIDGDGDGIDVVDMGADEFNPATYHPMTYVFLPLLTRNACSGALFFDDFSDPGSGWPVVLDNPALRLEYLYGEYRMLRNRTDGYLVATPGIAASDYSLSVVARNWNGLFGSYGLAFGMSEDLSQFYTFEVYSDGWYGLYHHSSGDWTVLGENMSSAVNPGASSNQLKVERNGALINGYVNGQLVTSVSDGLFTGSRYVGLILSTYDQAGLDACFDNFAVYSPGCSPGNAGLGQVSVTSELDVAHPAWPSHWASRENRKGR
jgi:hypothetical protein